MRSTAALAIGIAALALALAAPAAAATYVMMTDEDLVDQAPLIGLVSVIRTDPVRDQAATDYLVQLVRPLKGNVPGEMVVRVLGGVGPDGARLTIPGAPEFQVGQRAILFLKDRDDGMFGIVQWMLGAFHEVREAGRSLAVRDLSQARELSPPDRGQRRPDRPRNFDRFADWLSDRAQGLFREKDYEADVVGASPAISAPYTLLGKARWFTFDDDGTATWVTRPTGQSGMTGGGFKQFQQALAAWDGDPSTVINYAYGGTSGTNGDLRAMDGVNMIQFDDPNDYISGSFDCSRGGVLAMGGWWSLDSGTFGGQTFGRIVEGDIVTQDGSGCFLSGHGGADGAEVFTHELGHTLGLGHSCGDAASGACDTADKDNGPCARSLTGTAVAPSSPRTTAPASSPSIRGL